MITFINYKANLLQSNYITVSLPDAVQVGDLLLCSVGVYVGEDINTSLLVTSTGWTLLGSVATNPVFTAITAKIFLFYRFVTSIEEKVYLFSDDDSLARTHFATIAAYRGVLSAAFVNVSSFVSVEELDYVTATLTTTVEDTHMVVGVLGMLMDGYIVDEAETDIDFTIRDSQLYNNSILGGNLVYLLGDGLKTPKEAGSVEIDADPSTDYLHVFFAVALIPAPQETSFTDTYKSKLLRQMLPTPYNTTLGESHIANLVSVIGSSDNAIGGLYGEDDFLP